MNYQNSQSGNLRIYDIGKLGKLISGNKALKPLASDIEMVLRTYSLRMDLHLASRCSKEIFRLVDLNRIEGEPIGFDDIVFHSLLSQSILFYTRATKRSSSYRKQFDFYRQFSSEQRQTHLRICKLFDDAIAHFGPGIGQNGIPWTTEKLIHTIRDNKVRIMVVTKRVGVDLEMAFVIQSQIEAAYEIIHKESDLRGLALDKRLAHIIINDPYSLPSAEKFFFAEDQSLSVSDIVRTLDTTSPALSAQPYFID